jgi:hypothetical protein
MDLQDKQAEIPLENPRPIQVNRKKSTTNQNIGNFSIVSRSKTTKVKPRFFKLLGQIMNYHFDDIMNYLQIKDLTRLRCSNKMYLALVHEYFPKRLRFEVDRIRVFQEDNYDVFLNFMKIIDSQIPLSNKNCLDFDLNIVIDKLKILDKNIITNMKSIKSIGKLPEAVFAPFCIILGYNVGLLCYYSSLIILRIEKFSPSAQ